MSNENKTATKKASDYYKVHIADMEHVAPEDAVVYANLDSIPKLSELIGEEKIKYEGVIYFEVHNPFVKDGNTDYSQFVVITDKGAYTTGSESFYSSLMQLVTIRTELGIEGDMYFKVVERESKNNAGKMLLASGVKATN